jgi:hypothetical protein
MLGRDAFNLARVLKVEPGFLEEEHAHQHDEDVAGLSPLEGGHQRAWKADEARLSRLVSIGRDLPKEALRGGFERCVAAS